MSKLVSSVWRKSSNDRSSSGIRPSRLVSLRTARWTTRRPHNVGRWEAGVKVISSERVRPFPKASDHHLRDVWHLIEWPYLLFHAACTGISFWKGKSLLSSSIVLLWPRFCVAYHPCKPRVLCPITHRLLFVSMAFGQASRI